MNRHSVPQGSCGSVECALEAGCLPAEQLCCGSDGSSACSCVENKLKEAVFAGASPFCTEVWASRTVVHCSERAAAEFGHCHTWLVNAHFFPQNELSQVKQSLDQVSSHHV